MIGVSTIRAAIERMASDSIGLGTIGASRPWLCQATERGECAGAFSTAYSMACRMGRKLAWHPMNQGGRAGRKVTGGERRRPGHQRGITWMGKALGMATWHHLAFLQGV